MRQSVLLAAVLALAGASALLSLRAARAWRGQEATASGVYALFPNAGIRLKRPAGFDPAESFDGFQQEASGASVMVVRVPGPFAEVTRGFTAEQMAARGMTLRRKEEVRIDGTPGVLVDATQEARGVTFGKWIAAFGDASQTFLITANYPAARAGGLSATLKATVLSARRDDGAPPPADAALPFTLSHRGKLRLTRGMGKMLLYTRDGVLPAKSPEDPLFVVAPSLGDAPVADRKAFAAQRLRQTAHTADIAIISNQPIRVDGLEGYESLAKGWDTASGTPLQLYQVVLFDGDGYILMQGLVGTRLGGEYLPEFKAMAKSLRRKGG